MSGATAAAAAGTAPGPAAGTYAGGGASGPTGPAWRSPAALRAVGTRLGFTVAGAIMLGALRIHRPPGLATICALRATTGIPCPLCGGTTTFVRLGRGRVVDGVLANPFALLAVLALVLAPTGLLAPLRRPRGNLVILAFVAASWLWQLGRFGYLT